LLVPSVRVKDHLLLPASKSSEKRVLATLWPVDDQTTAQLMKRFYSELRAGKTAANALAIAQRSTLNAQGSRSPFYWAGFVLDGSL
jgi:CHAT domain-containing protein